MLCKHVYNPVDLVGGGAAIVLICQLYVHLICLDKWKPSGNDFSSPFVPVHGEIGGRLRLCSVHERDLLSSQGVPRSDL